MRLLIFTIVFISFNFNTTAYSHQFIKKDTVENVFYEYDTVYMAPDTIRITDTIIDYQTVQPVEEITNSECWSIGLEVVPFTSNIFNSKSSIDSFSLKNTVNYIYSLKLQYVYRGFIIGLGVGITPLHDRIRYTSANNFLISNDSISIVTTNTSENYYRYFNFYLNVGRKWGKSKFHYSFNAGLIADVLIDYNARFPIDNQYNKISDNFVRKIGLAVMLNPSISYRIWKKLDFYISPLYRYNLNKRNLYPLSNLQNAGIGLGLNLIL
jgi:hypothetical protein